MDKPDLSKEEQSLLLATYKPEEGGADTQAAKANRLLERLEEAEQRLARQDAELVRLRMRLARLENEFALLAASAAKPAPAGSGPMREEPHPEIAPTGSGNVSAAGSAAAGDIRSASGAGDGVGDSTGGTPSSTASSPSSVPSRKETYKRTKRSWFHRK